MSHLKDIEPAPNLWSFFKELENDGVSLGFPRLESPLPGIHHDFMYSMFVVCDAHFANREVGRHEDDIPLAITIFVFDKLLYLEV